MRTKTRWLDRRIAAPGPCLALCLSEAEFKAAMRSAGVVPINSWIKTAHSDATTHFVTSCAGVSTVIVCISGWQGRNPIEVAGLLIHEAVHVWQEYCANIGENAPGVEQEAYAIQAISQELMAEFCRRMQ